MTAHTGPDLVREQYRHRREVVERFFAAEAERIAVLCHAMACRFARGGRLLVFGAGAAATDAQHVSVEFVHPVIVGKRALPAVALVNDVSTLGSALVDPDGLFARRIDLFGRSEDIALGLVHGPDDPGRAAVATGVDRAAAGGMLPIWLGAAGVEGGSGEHRFEVDCDDPFIVQEVHETLYHVLWELVHVFFDHKGLLADRVRGSTHDSGRSSFLYPFLAEAEHDLADVLAEIKGSILKKATDVAGMRDASLEPEALTETARLVSERLRAGGKVLAIGNGGSATDAQDLVADLVAPPPGLMPLPALSLANDDAVMTAVGNDVGFENVFARQVIAHGGEQDVAVAISTSGGSRNVLAAMEEAARRGLLTVALVGYGGGRLAELCDRVHVIDADYIPRIQEAQATQYHVLRRLL
jgi:D-sedoheptulose 7-phosphate isomerase